MSNRRIIDYFDNEVLADEWIIGPAEDQRNDRYWSITKKSGYLTITTQRSDIHLGGNNPCNFFLRKSPYDHYEISTEVFFKPEQNFEQAGLVIFSDADNYLRHAYVHAYQHYIEVSIEVNQKYSNQMLPITDIDHIHLKIRKLDRKYSYFISFDGKCWEQVGTSVFASFESPLVGIMAISPGSGRALDAHFKYFSIEEINPEDYQEDKKLPSDSVIKLPSTNQVQYPYINPVFNNDAPDPCILKDKDNFYAMVTENVYQDEFYRLMILRSKNLVDWQPCGMVFPDQVPAWINQKSNYLWAPDLSYHNGRYYVYFSALGKGGKLLDGPHGIGVAWAKRIEGPYEFMDEPLLIGSGFRYIDPMVFTDDDGTRYLYWGSNHQPLYVQELAADGLSLVGKPKPVVLPQWGPIIIDGDFRPRPGHESLIEGVWVIKREDYYYLFYSGDNITVDRYAVGVARATSPLGPFEKNPMNSILLHNNRFTAPGHNSIIQDDAGQDWIIYHAIDRTNERLGRIMLIDRIDWKNGWPVINNEQGPSYTLQKRGPIMIKEVSHDENSD